MSTFNFMSVRFREGFSFASPVVSAVDEKRRKKAAGDEEDDAGIEEDEHACHPLKELDTTLRDFMSTSPPHDEAKVTIPVELLLNLTSSRASSNQQQQHIVRKL